MESFNYVNEKGYNKVIRVFPEKVDENGRYYFQIWTGKNDTMEATDGFCGCGYKSIAKLNEFFAHYHIDYHFDVK